MVYNLSYYCDGSQCRVGASICQQDGIQCIQNVRVILGTSEILKFQEMSFLLLFVWCLEKCEPGP